MASMKKIPAYAVYSMQKSTEDNSGANETLESSPKLRKRRGRPRYKYTEEEKQTPVVIKKQKLEEEASITKKENKKKKGRKAVEREPVIVDQEKNYAEVEEQEHSESTGEHSEEYSECIEETTSTNGGDIIPWATKTKRFSSKVYSCGTEAAEDSFRWLLSPIAPNQFFKEIFEESPYYLNRNVSTYYHGLFSTSDFDKIMKENRLEYNKEIDIVTYSNGKRQPLENGQIVLPDFVWDSYNTGYSVRMRNPQAYHQPLWKLCSLLQEYFSSCVGANMYLTPAYSQGFPPHWDDIDAFILQLEGKKLWKVYSPRHPMEEMPQLSSPDLDESTIGEPILEQEIKAGDMLYIPRGFIHQAQATDEYSLHMTISTNQLNTWSDFLHHGIEAALEKATEANVELRKSIPKDFLDYAGCAIPQTDASLETQERSAFRIKARKLLKNVLDHFTVDAAADVHAAHFIHGCMRPIFNQNEAIRSIHGNGNKFRNGVVRKISSLTPDSRVRWIRKRAFRLVMDDEGPKLFHTLGNGKNFKEVETSFLDVDESAVPAVCALFKQHPEYIKVKDLPLQGNMAAKREFAEVLYYNGFLMTDQPLPPEGIE